MERIKAVIGGRDPIVLKQLFAFYSRPKGKIVDVTCNTRKMWKGLPVERVTFCDIDPTVKPDVICDFKKTPFADDEVSVIVFDPPHLPSAAASPESMGQMISSYGLDKSVSGDNIDAVFIPFLTEARRVLKDDGLIFCKLIDFVHNHKYQWTLVSFVNAIRQVSGMTATDLVIKCDPCAGNLSSGRWEKCHHARRASCWWVVVRKGKCEPKEDYPPDPL